MVRLACGGVLLDRDYDSDSIRSARSRNQNIATTDPNQIPFLKIDLSFTDQSIQTGTRCCGWKKQKADATDAPMGRPSRRLTY